MFTRSDLEKIPVEQLTHWKTVTHYPRLYYITYPLSAFRNASSEECIRVTRARRQIEDNGLRFWLSEEWLDDWRGREVHFSKYVRNAEFELISEDDFNRIVAEQASRLIAPFEQPLHPPSGFICAQLMFSMNSDFIVSLIAEYEDEFVHFHWSTTA